eukprot:5708091-Amphidinium_carterae.1
MISGRQAIVIPNLKQSSSTEPLKTEAVLQKGCKKLGISSAGSMCLVSGDDVVPAKAKVQDWPGIRAPGEISEYQLAHNTAATLSSIVHWCVKPWVTLPEPSHTRAREHQASTACKLAEDWCSNGGQIRTFLCKGRGRLPLLLAQ